MIKISSLAVATLLATNADAFTISPLASNAMRTSVRDNSNVLKMANSAADEVAALRAKAQKMKDDAAQLEKDLGREVSDVKPKVEVVKEIPVLSSSEVKDTVANINFEAGDYASQVEAMTSLYDSNKLGLWSAALTSSVNTNSPAPLRPYPVSLNFLEQRTGGKITGTTLGVGGEDDVSLDDFKYATLWVTGGSTVAGIASLALLPENTGATLCYFFALIPILFLGIGSSAPGIIAGAIKGFKENKDDKAAQEDRICRHEAGHFLCGYLCGLPIKSYQANDAGIPCVEFYPTSDGNFAGRELEEQEICAMSVVAMSGSVAEVLQFGEAKGGSSDLIELNGLFSRTKDFMGAQKQQDMTRWGALTAYNIISSNEDKFDRLVAAFKSKKSVTECIAAIEASN